MFHFPTWYCGRCVGLLIWRSRVRSLALSSCCFLRQETSLKFFSICPGVWIVSGHILYDTILDRYRVQSPHATETRMSLVVHAWTDFKVWPCPPAVPWGRNFIQSCLSPLRCINCYWRLTAESNPAMDRHRVQLLHVTETRISSLSGSWTNYLAILATILEFCSYLCSFCHHQYIQQSIRTRRIRMCWYKQRLCDNGCYLRCIHPNLSK